MEPVDESEKFCDLKVSKDAIIETVAESILSQDKPIAVIDDNNEIVGSIHASHVINILFGGRSDKAKQN
jgi:glycine betaine/proline transport system ATP-binding protein